MVRFYGLCDSKIMVKKIFFKFLCGIVYYFSQNFWLPLSNCEQLIVNYV